MFLFAMIAAGFAPAAAQAAYIKLDPIVITDSSEQLTVSVTLQVDPNKKTDLEYILPDLAVAFRKQLHELAANGVMMQGQTVELKTIKAAFMDAAHKVAPKGLAFDMRLSIVKSRT